MTARIYIALFDTPRPLEPAFRNPGPAESGRAWKGATEVMGLDAFATMQPRQIRALVGELARAAGRRDLVPAAIGGPDDIDEDEQTPPAMPWPEGAPELPDQNHFDPSETYS